MRNYLQQHYLLISGKLPKSLNINCVFNIKKQLNTIKMVLKKLTMGIAALALVGCATGKTVTSASDYHQMKPAVQTFQTAQPAQVEPLEQAAEQAEQAPSRFYQKELQYFKEHDISLEKANQYDPGFCAEEIAYFIGKNVSPEEAKPHLSTGHPIESYQCAQRNISKLESEMGNNDFAEVIGCESIEGTQSFTESLGDLIEPSSDSERRTKCK